MAELNDIECSINHISVMNLIEFRAYWPGQYTKEERKDYKSIHGDDMEEWPDSNQYGSMTIDLSKVCRFNPHTQKDKTTIELCGGYSYSLVIRYDDFKMLMNAAGFEIKNYKDLLK